MPEIGQQFEGYEVLEQMGRGHMGAVYKARETATGRPAVIKLLSEDLLDNDRAVERFKREIRSSLQLEHPALIQTYHAGQVDGQWYYVMEFVEGTTVKKELLRGPYEEPRAIEITLRVAEALEYASQFNLVHRDIKPENIMISPDGQVKLGDMGLAKSTDSTNKLTMLGTVLGTPHYMSPEQARGEEDIDFRSDIYSLGATFYHMLAGYPPFDGDDPVQVITNLLSKEPPSPRDHKPGLSDGACYVIARMLCKKREERYETMRALIEDLERLQRAEKTEAEASGRTKIASQTPAKHVQYKFSHVPSDRDMLFGKIALRNKLTNKQDLTQALDLQEEAAHHGAQVDLGDLMLVKNLLTAAQKAAIDQASCQYEVERAKELFLKAAVDNRFLDPRQMAEARKLQRVMEKDLVAVLLAKGYLDHEQREMIYCYQKQAKRSEEDRFFVKVAMENKFITEVQAQKCTVIQSNGMVMGRYRDLGRIMVEKAFIKQRHKEVILRAIRRNFLTGTSVADLIVQQQLDAPDTAVEPQPEALELAEE